MGLGNGDAELKQRIRAGQLTREDVARRLAELAFGKANDCVKLVLEDDAALEKLDLSLLTEVKRNDKGTVEVRLVDRLKALEQLALLAQAGGEDLESFLKALQGEGLDGLHRLFSKAAEGADLVDAGKRGLRQGGDRL